MAVRFSSADPYGVRRSVREDCRPDSRLDAECGGASRSATANCCLYAAWVLFTLGPIHSAPQLPNGERGRYATG
jgi:hypothetical protein